MNIPHALLLAFCGTFLTNIQAMELTKAQRRAILGTLRFSSYPSDLTNPALLPDKSPLHPTIDNDFLPYIPEKERL